MHVQIEFAAYTEKGHLRTFTRIRNNRPATIEAGEKHAEKKGLRDLKVIQVRRICEYVSEEDAYSIGKVL